MNLLIIINNRDETSDYWMNPVIKLAIILRFLAGSTMYDIVDEYGFNVACCHYVKRDVITAILNSSIGHPDLLVNINKLDYLIQKA